MPLFTAMNKLAKWVTQDPRLDAIYIPQRGGRRQDVPEAETFAPIGEILNRMKTPVEQGQRELRSLLLLGDSGMGKTSLGLKLCEIYWRRWLKQHETHEVTLDASTAMPRLVERIPIYVYLPEFKAHLNDLFLERVFMAIGLVEAERLALLAQPLMLVLDGLDEITPPENFNLYANLGFERGGCDIKMIICCRPSARPQQALMEAPLGLGFGRGHETIYLQAFTERQISAYIGEYVKRQPVHAPIMSPAATNDAIPFAQASSSTEPLQEMWPEKTYLDWIERLPSLKVLIKTPFLLTIAIQVLPTLAVELSQTLTRDADESSAFKEAKTKKFTQNGLFKVFLKQWFHAQAERINKQGRLRDLTQEEREGYMHAYAQNLAASLLLSDGQLDERALSLDECLRPELIEPVHDVRLLAKFNRQDSRLCQSRYFFDVDERGQKSQSLVQRENLKAISSGCLLHTIGERFKFLHKAITEYLIYRELMEGILGTYDHYLDTLLNLEQRDRGLNRRLLTKEPVILASLAEEVNRAKPHQRISITSKPRLRPQPPSILAGHMPQGAVIQFIECPVAGDGNCGFATLGITRAEVVEILGALASHQEARAFLCQEIHGAFSEPMVSGGIVPSPEWQALLSIRDNQQAVFDRTYTEYHDVFPVQVETPEAFIAWLGVQVGEAETKAYVDLSGKVKVTQASYAALLGYCQSEAAFSYYIQQYAYDIPGRRLWLGQHSAILYARTKQISVYIWQKHADGVLGSSSLTLMDYHNAGAEAIGTVHMLHGAGLTHFNRLEVYQSPAPTVIEAAPQPDAALNSEPGPEILPTSASFRDLLFEIIEASKETPGLSIAAANAITVLNRAGVSFCNCDFSDIQIPGADLRGGIFWRTNFRSANLEAVNFHQAELKYTQWQGANTAEINFGERASFKAPSAITCLASYYPDIGITHWLVGCHNGYVYRYDMCGKLVAKYRHKGYSPFADDRTTPLAAIAVHSAHHIMATGGRDGLIWLWSLKDGSIIQRLEADTKWVVSFRLSISMDGLWLITAGGSRITLWRLPEGTLRAKLDIRHVNNLYISINRVGFEKQGQFVFGEDKEGVIYRWILSQSALSIKHGESNYRSQICNIVPEIQWDDGDLRDNISRLKRLLNREPQFITPFNRPHRLDSDGLCFAFSADGWFASKDFKTLSFWQIPDENNEPVLTTGFKSFIEYIAISGDGDWLAAASWSMERESSKIRLWRRTLAWRSGIELPCRGGGDCLAFSPDSAWLATGHSYLDKAIRLWRLSDGTLGPVLIGHTGSICRLAFSPSGDYLISGGDYRDKTIRVWCLREGTCQQVFQNSEGSISSLVIKADGTFIAGSSISNVILLQHISLETTAKKVALALPEYSRKTIRVKCISSDGSLVAQTVDDSGGMIYIYHLPEGTPGSILYGPGKYVSGCEFSSHGWLASLHHNVDSPFGSPKSTTLCVWEMPSGKLLNSLSTEFYFSYLAINGNQLYVGGMAGCIASICYTSSGELRFNWLWRGIATLFLSGLNLNNVISMSTANFQLCKQRGAVGTPSPSYRLYQPWCDLFKEIPGTAHIQPQEPLIKVGDACPYRINKDRWTVSIARSMRTTSFSFDLFGTGSRGEDHAFLIIEGIKNYRRFIIKAELTYDTGTAHVDIHLKPLDDLARFQASLARGIEAHQVSVSAEDGFRLLRSIQADQQKPIYYKATGANLFTQSDEIETHSCLTWCRKQLAVINEALPKRWYNFIITLPSDVTAPKEASSLNNETSTSSTHALSSEFRR